ncbi:MAG: hypothetical protein QM479_01415 [Pseudomonadota bacterium]
MDKGFVSLIIASMLLLFTLGGVAWYKSQMNVTLEITAAADVDKNCDLNLQQCQSKIQNVGEVNFSILPTPIPLVSDLSLSVNTDIKNIKQVVVDFKGIDMEMGPNKVILKQQADGSYTGKGMLPVCIRYSMNWKASVYIESSEGLYMAPYLFETHK